MYPMGLMDLNASVLEFYELGIVMAMKSVKKWNSP